jgi:uncharacterized membrane protein
MMAFRRAIDLATPIGIAYELCRQLEDLPRLLPAVLEVTPEEPNGVRYRIALGDRREPFRVELELTEAEPNRRIAWRLLDGPVDRGAISFEAIATGTTRLAIEIVPSDDADLHAIEPELAQVALEFSMLPRAVANVMRAQTASARAA